MLISGDPEAYAHNHCTMPTHERGESRLVSVFDEVRQQLSVAHSGFIGDRRLAESLDNLGKPVNRHVQCPLAQSRPTTNCPAGRDFIGFFLGPAI